MAEENKIENIPSLSVGDHTRIGIIEVQINTINDKLDDVRALASNMSDMKDAILRLTLIQEQLQDISKKRDVQFIESSANTERQWKKIAKTDVRLEQMAGMIAKTAKELEEHRKHAEALEESERKGKIELEKTRIQGKWMLVAAIVTSAASLITAIIVAIL